MTSIVYKYRALAGERDAMLLLLLVSGGSKRTSCKQHDTYF